jgi:pre-rRNA-processing protein TSR3
MALTPPQTVIIRHPRESPQKCSILPLKGRPDVCILLHPVTKLPPLEGYIRLAADGPPLTEADCACGLLLLDSCWRRVGRMFKNVEHVPPRSLYGYQTAYPRTSKLGTDPDNGLASVEALFLAYHILGRPTDGLLDHYHWAEEFLRLNGLEHSRHA